MKTKLLTLTAIAAVFAVSSAHAISWTYSEYRDVDLVGKTLTNNGDESQKFAEGTFEISFNDADSYHWDAHTFDNTKEKLIGAEIGLGFYHNNQGTLDYLGDFRYHLGENLLPFVGSVGAAGGFAGFDLNIVTPYIGELTGALLLELNDNGVLDWRVELNENFQGEVVLHWAALAADAEPIPDSGSTFAMLGMAALAAFAAKRRSKSQR
ncbi:hypothetical protein [Pelagicoccus sp. SDUM812002]|uniref:hypothetical protein n=1 Tax=Pelagicoccus sp. SDUM812002 TaxID=3041266 RepID=UPI00280E5986|nr:hypothetical protein [Pelagicoccus sp. SDUM812002]MDQ8186267.1 hypothetical protein [Pelagicoccus sp. SDUM812002]